MVAMMNSIAKWMFSVLALICVAKADAGQNAKDLTYWSRGFFIHPAEGYTAAHRFQLWGVTFDRDRLTGRFSLYQITDNDAPTIQVEGVKAAAGTFLPHATLQIADTASGEWKTVGKNCNDGEPGTVSVSRGEMNLDLYVCLDAYKPFLTTHRRARVLLNSGDAAIFELSDLAPTPR